MTDRDFFTQDENLMIDWLVDNRDRPVLELVSTVIPGVVERASGAGFLGIDALEHAVTVLYHMVKVAHQEVLNIRNAELHDEAEAYRNASHGSSDTRDEFDGVTIVEVPLVEDEDLPSGPVPVDLRPDNELPSVDVEDDQ